MPVVTRCLARHWGWRGMKCTPALLRTECLRPTRRLASSPQTTLQPSKAVATQASFGLCQQLSCFGTFTCVIISFWRLLPRLCLANSDSSIRYQLNVTSSKKPSPTIRSGFSPSPPLCGVLILPCFLLIPFPSLQLYISLRWSPHQTVSSLKACPIVPSKFDT